MDLLKKLQIPPGTRVFLVDAPDGFKIGLQLSKSEKKNAAVLMFAANSKKLGKNARVAIEAARTGRLSWIAYPKAGQLGTDLNRDKLQELMKRFGIEGVRLVSVDDVWSAMRFRPKK